MGYVGYDPCALGVLLGALDRALDERLPARPLSTEGGRRAFDRAVTAHRRQLIALGDVADLVGLVLRADPLGAYRIVAVDPHDLELWAYHRGGRWRTAHDPTVTEAGWSRQFEVLNARLVAGWLTPDRWRELLDGEKEAAAPVLRYLSHLAGDAPARSAFLDAIGPEQFAALLRTASTRYTSTHLTDDADQPALRAVDALGALWAADRAQGGRRTARGTLLRSAATSSPDAPARHRRVHHGHPHLGRACPLGRRTVASSDVRVAAVRAAPARARR